MSGDKNNRVWRADVASSQCYVLRLAPNPGYTARVRFEAALLEALSHQQPPFLLPLPLQTRQGDIIVPFEQEHATPTCATLFPLLPGHLPEDWSDLASHAGYTLAWLDRALATLPAIPVTQPIFASS